MTDAQVDWQAYRQCPMCKAGTGVACWARSGRIIGGVPDGVGIALEQPHRLRRLRTGYGLRDRGVE